MMNREILFKAKRKNLKELPKEKWWVEGIPMKIEVDYVMLLNHDENTLHPTYAGMYRADVYATQIDENTICQYTGLKDKNGNMIWENDIVNCYESECFGVIKWEEDEAKFIFDIVLEDLAFEPEDVYDYIDDMEVVGNIFDNPELLKGSEENG